jgi:hypothetical protein
MPDLGQAQTGELRSTPKQLKLSGSDKSSAAFKCMGNNHYIPWTWASQAVVASGTDEVTLASGVKFYDMDLASYANVVATPKSDPGGRYWLEYDTDDNIIKLVVGSSVSGDVTFNVQVMLGAAIDVSRFNTRGTGAPSQSYP